MRPAREAFARQRDFVADASHELKTPLALAKVNAEEIRRNPSSPNNREIVEDQLSEIDRMDALLSDLLTLARLDSGRLEVEKKPFDLAVVAGEAAERFLKRAAAEHLQLEISLPRELPVRGDAARTGQILAALLDNAVRHTPQGGPSPSLVRHWMARPRSPSRTPAPAFLQSTSRASSSASTARKKPAREKVAAPGSGSP